MTPRELSILVKTLARDAGFDLAGITRASPSPHADAFRQWIAAGKHGEMAYLARDLDRRLDITQKFPWAKSVISLALAYYREKPGARSQKPEAAAATDQRTTDPTTDHGPLTTGQGRIARYAWGRDYHKVIAAKLQHLETRLRQSLSPPNSPFLARSYCDTGPVLERELAARAGLGWIGKNTLLIHPQHGSFFVLGELVIDLELEPDSPLPDHCGTCQRCIQACPTGAITPYSVDATKCISYLTLEHRSLIPENLHPAMQAARFLIGCDICQEVCPFNRAPLAATGDSGLGTPDYPLIPAMSLQQILAWQERDWDQQTRGRAFRRTKLAMFRRNAEILAASVPS